MFQNSVLKSITQDEGLVALRWAAYQEFLKKIDFIKDVKEEKYQDGFLKDIFENSLGYTLDTTNPKDFNLEREKKNETDAKKADGVIYVDGKVVGVIELKAQDTKNLDKVQQQAFWYLTQHSDAKYVVISNFDELRFYLDKSTSYERFSLFNLSYDEFKKLHLILSYESIKQDIPLKLKEKSNNFEKDISSRLYKDFSNFRTNLFQNILHHNTHDKSELLRLTQKLCDRILFILFAEDRGLLRSNTIKEIREEYKAQKFTSYTLYDIYKFYFEGINSGNDRLNIPKYNGGLFAKDEMLDNLLIDDEYLDVDAQKLSDYDFMSDVSVNILGHIFEQSLTELEEINAQLNNIEFDIKKTKRKKDGVFYTPSFITEYIVENTLGKICKAKKIELELFGLKPPKNSKKTTKKEQQLSQNLSIYREWLLSLKILDPACGSGAFLNQALEFLIAEHRSLQKDLVVMGDITAYYEIEKSILENNLYGIDINEDAVEIAKLSLWLRTATKGRELTKLAHKIVCANSLLDEPFGDTKFDVVIGNPPYVRVQGLKSNYENEAKLYEEKFVSAKGNYDIYVLFLEMSYKLLSDGGKLGFILPHKFLISDFGSGIRGFLEQNKAVESLLHFGSEMVFEDVSTYTCIVTLSHANTEVKFKHIKPKDIFYEFEYDTISYDKLSKDKWSLTNFSITKVLDKLYEQPLCVKDVFSKIFTGIQTSADNIYLLEKTKDGLYSKSLDKIVTVEDGLLKPLLKGDDIHRYKNLKNKYYVIFPYIIENTKAKPMSENYIEDNFKNGYEYLKANEEFLRGREKGRMDKDDWFLYIYPKSLTSFAQEKIITREICLKSQMSYDNGIYYHNTKCYSFIKKDEVKEDYKYFLSIFNSSLFWFFIKNTGYELKGGYFTYKSAYLNKFPLPQLPHANLHKKNINYLLTMPKKAKYDKTTKYAIASYEGREIYMSEFLMAKELGYIDKFQGHSELKEYMRLIPLVFSSNIFDSIYKNINDDRMIYAIDENSRKIFHVVDKDDFLVSVFVVSEVNFKKQLGRRFELVKNPNGGTATPHILSPARPFWRHLDLMEQLYHTLSKNSKDYEEILSALADEMLDLNKELQYKKTLFLDELKLDKIPKKLQNFYQLSFDEFINEYKKAKKLKFKDKLQERDFKQEWQRMFESDKEDILSIKDKISKTDKKIDEIVYELYNLDEDEIKTIEENI